MPPAAAPLAPRSTQGGPLALFLAATLVAAHLPLAGCASTSDTTSTSQSTSTPATQPAPSTPEPNLDLPELAPPDFSLSVTIATTDPNRDPATLARWQRPARYIVEPGGAFRAAVRPGARVDAYPPLIRTLSRAQIESLWTSVRTDAWLTRPADGSRFVVAPDLESVPREVQRRSALVWISAVGVRRGVIVPLASGTPESDAAARLVDQLADLSWVKNAN